MVWRSRERHFFAFLLVMLFAGFSAGWFASSFSSFRAVPANDGDYFPIAYSLISNANKSIHLAIFYAKYYPSYPDSKSNLLLEELARKAKDVEVKVYLDDLFNESSSGYEFLRERGVDVRYGGMRTVHAKLLIVDGKYVLLGSTNWGYYSLSRNHEANVLIDSEGVARAFEDYFSMIWSESLQ